MIQLMLADRSDAPRWYASGDALCHTKTHAERPSKRAHAERRHDHQWCLFCPLREQARSHRTVAITSFLHRIPVGARLPAMVAYQARLLI